MTGDATEPCAAGRWLLLLEGHPKMEWYWPLDQVPYVGQIIAGYVSWWWGACLLRFPGPKDRVVSFRVVEVDGTHVLAEGPIDVADWSPVPLESLS